MEMTVPDQETDITRLSASELLRHYRRKTLSPVDVTKAVFDRIERDQPAVNAFCVIDPDTAMVTARASEGRWMKGAPEGLVDGVPTTIKDVVLTKDWPTLRGSRAIDPEQSWPDDAPCTARLREQGAVLLGKTTTPEFGWKGVTDNTLTGVTRNPWNTSRTTAGSSGGAAAAAATGMGALHIGTDGGGSIRMPAAFTGVFGHKPTFGRVPAWPASPFGTLAHIGPLTRTVADAALMMNVLAMPDHRDWFSIPANGRDYTIGLDDGVAGLRIAYSPDLGHATVDPEIAALVRNAADVFSDLGANVEVVNPDIGDTREIFRHHWYVGAAALLDGFSDEQKSLMDPGLLEVAAEGAEISVLSYMEAAAARAAIGGTMRDFHETYDLLLTPAVAIPAFEAGRETPVGWPEKRWTSWTPFTYPFNLTQQPACSAPCGFTSDGLPAGLQIVGRNFDDALVLRAARAFESARPFKMPADINIQH